MNNINTLANALHAPSRKKKKTPCSRLNRLRPQPDKPTLRRMQRQYPIFDSGTTNLHTVHLHIDIRLIRSISMLNRGGADSVQG